MSKTQIREECTPELRTRRIVVEDEQGRDRVIIGDNEAGFTSVTMLDERGVMRLTMQMTEGGTPSVNLHDPKGDARVSLSCAAGGALSLCEIGRGWRAL